MKSKAKNKYYNRSHISEAKFRQLIKCFSMDLNAYETSQITNISHVSCKKIFNKLRVYIVKNLLENNSSKGEFELDESYFGAKRVRGKRGRGAAGKTPVFGLLKRNGNVYVQIVKNCSKEQLIPIIQGKILEGSTIHTDGWKAYGGLVLNGYDHYRVFHSKDEFARGKAHVNGIESFWSFTKRRLSQFNGLSDKTFYLHLKESEFRFNNLYDITLNFLRKNKL
ncbi:IS1595 family transposase [Candidatus Persebacteraceae bacterium Df01]|jgi:transposase-like protein|uniref:IS1595 family transposase n=1 Tax=Candidatus Doriopsillibacter californiensis TaxID=2970740 RepID=A0ABT7QNG1_9GAMM|nr:IS1595 family transposase [Candidatus Persebacteraceae bacterium Df01]